MAPWHLEESDLKKYPHFDTPIAAGLAEEYANDGERVARHAFYPFIRYTQRWTRFAPRGKKPDVKERPIRYAARRDAYIFARYRYVLSERYEKELARLGLTGNVLAYRKIPATADGTNKCNIHFARDAFLGIRALGDCCVVALDVSSYFESIDHARLKNLWCRMLGVSRLPADHFKVFSAITQYAVVDKQAVYERLGHFGEKIGAGGKRVRGYLTPYRRVPKKLCSGREFRRIVAGGRGKRSIIQKNYKPYGIPQRAPISVLLANLYLLDFDAQVAAWARDVGGKYYRYSDDILVIVPGGGAVGFDLMRRVRSLIGNFGSELRIKDEKSSLFVFSRRGSDQEFRLVAGRRGRNGLEYLGFRYSGKAVYLRDATLSNLRRKVARAAYREADSCARRYPDKDVAGLKGLFNYERLIKRFGKVEGFGEGQKDYRSWTFWTYARRASELFGPLGGPILRQLRRHRLLIRVRADRELERAVARRDRRRMRR